MSGVGADIMVAGRTAVVPKIGQAGQGNKVIETVITRTIRVGGQVTGNETRHYRTSEGPDGTRTSERWNPLASGNEVVGTMGEWERVGGNRGVEGIMRTVGGNGNGGGKTEKNPRNAAETRPAAQDDSKQIDCSP